MSTPENTTGTNTRSTFSTLIVMGCTLVSRLLGFVRNALIASLFGAGGTASVLHLTFAVPNNLRKLMAEGALSSAFIPEISHALVEEPDGKRSKRLTSLLIGFQLTVLIPVSILSVIFAEPLVTYVLSEIRDPDKLRLAVDLFRWFIFYIILISVNATMMAVLNSHGRFFTPAFTPVLFSVAVISSLLLFYRRLGVFSMAMGVILGGFAQILFQLPSFIRQGYSLFPSFNFRSPGFVRIMRRWGPVVASSSIFSIIQIIAMRFASGIDEKGVAGLQNAILFWQLPMGIFSASVVTVLFPRMSRQAAKQDTDALGETIRLGIDMLVVLLLPSMLVLGFLGREIIAVAYQRHLFTAEDTRYTFSILLAYATGLFSVGAFNFMQRYYYAMNRYRSVTITALIVALVDILLSLWWKETALGVAGLAYANTAAFSLGFLLLYLPTLKITIVATGKRNLITFGKTCAALIPGVAVFLAKTVYFSNWWEAGATWPNLLRLAAVTALFSFLTLGMYAVIGLEAVKVLFRAKGRG